MANASIDENFISGSLAVLNTDSVQGTNLVRIRSEGGKLSVTASDSISFTMVPISEQDENGVKVLLFEGTDGLLYPAVANSDGELLIDTTL